MTREELETQLGQIMHKICIQQKVVTEEQKDLQKLQQEANDVDQELSKLDAQ